LVASKVPRFAFRNPHFPSGDRGLWSHGNKQLRERFVVDLKSQVQQASRYRFGERRPNIPRSAFRNPHFPTGPGCSLPTFRVPHFCDLSFVISTAIGYWQSASLHSFSKNEYRYFAQNHRIESPRID
jgi:hypothetical protein